MCRSKAKNLPTMCLPSTMVTRTRALMNASILDCRLTATILKDVFTCALLDILLMNETRIKSNALFFSLSFGIQFFLSNRNVFCETLLVCTRRTERESLSLSLDSSSSIVPLLVALSKKSSSSASRRVRVCARALSFLSLFSLLRNNFLGSQKSRHFLGFPSLSLGVIQSRLLHPFFFHPCVIKGLLCSE